MWGNSIDNVSDFLAAVAAVLVLVDDPAFMGISEVLAQVSRSTFGETSQTEEAYM